MFEVMFLVVSTQWTDSYIVMKCPLSCFYFMYTYAGCVKSSFTVVCMENNIIIN